MRVLVALATTLVLACTTGYQVTNSAEGLEPRELAGAHRLYLGESAHPGMPHVTMNQRDAARAAARIAREIPDIALASSPEEAEFVISVLFVGQLSCTHCEMRPESQWAAIVERGGTAHRYEYSGIGDHLILSGSVREGASPTRGFVRQLKSLLRPESPVPGG